MSVGDKNLVMGKQNARLNENLAPKILILKESTKFQKIIGK